MPDNIAQLCTILPLENVILKRFPYLIFIHSDKIQKSPVLLWNMIYRNKVFQLGSCKVVRNCENVLKTSTKIDFTKTLVTPILSFDGSPHRDQKNEF